MRQIQIYENADILCGELAEALPIPASVSEPIHIALSGGSTPTLLFEKMTAVRTVYKTSFKTLYGCIA